MWWGSTVLNSSWNYRLFAAAAGGALACFVHVKTAHAQTVEELEKQVLTGKPSAAPEAAALPEPAPVAAPAPETAQAPVSEAAVAPETTAQAPAPKQEELPKDELEELDAAVKGPSEIPKRHILVVQHRYIRKEGRHEVAPLLVGVQLADSFRRQVQFGFSYTYHLTESFGIEALHAAFVKNYSTGLNDAIRSSVILGTDRLEDVVSLGSALQWTPLKSKAATDESIYHFEGYFLLGGGVSVYEDKPSAMLMYGVGFRSYATRTAVLKAELRNYADFRGHVSDRLNILLGASLLLGGE